jgi:hypothetical protein
VSIATLNCFHYKKDLQTSNTQAEIVNLELSDSPYTRIGLLWFITALSLLMNDDTTDVRLLRTYIPLTLITYPRRGSRRILNIPPFYNNYSVMSNTADMTGG